MGFDLDGALYDEADFISQVYEPISARLAASCGVAPKHIHAGMMRRWLEMGSSYNRIFDEVLDQHGVDGRIRETAIVDCLAIFRGFSPTLALPARVTAILELMQEQFALFLVSDGSAALQRAKIQALGLERWFSPPNVAIAGSYGPSYAKPAIEIVAKIAALDSGVRGPEVVYFGDREVDAQFARAAGFQHVRVSCLVPLGSD